MRSILRSTLLLAVAFVFLWNSGFIAAEYSLPYTAPFTLLCWRYWALTLILLIYLAFRGRLKWPGFSAVTLAFLVGILAHGVWLSCGLLSLVRGVPAGIVALVVALQPLTTGALSGLVVGERPPIYRWIGLIVGFCGVVIAVFARMDLRDPESVFGYLIPFGSVVAITIASLVQRRMEVHNQEYRLPVDVALFYQSLATALAMTVPAIALENLTTQWEPIFIGAMVWLIVGVSLPAYGLMWILLARIDATRVASLFYLGPPVTMVMAWAVFGDQIQLMDITGLIVVAIGVFSTQVTFTRPSGAVSEDKNKRHLNSSSAQESEMSMAARS